MRSGARSSDGWIGTAKLPRGPHSLTRTQVAAHQRQRIVGAMVSVVGERGYSATTVADVIALAGVSRKAFYEHFANKRDCFLTAFDLAVTTGLAQAADAYRGAASTHEGIEAAATMLLEHAVVNAPALKLVLIEIGAAGPEGVARRERHMRAYEDLLAECLGVTTRKRTLPSPILRALVGGVSEVLSEFVQSHRQMRQAVVAADLARWIMSYHPLLNEIARDLQPSSSVRSAGAGGRAPGTLAPRLGDGARRGLPRGRARSHSYVVHNQRERVLDAVANLNAAKGYAATSVRDIAEEAAVSLDAFYGHFLDKEDAFLVAYEIGHNRSLTIIEDAFAQAPGWCEGISAGLEGLFGFLASEPTYAHLALINAPLATPRTAERARRGLDSYKSLVERGFDAVRASSRPPSMTAAAVTGGLIELCSAYVMQGQSMALPAAVREATYFTLAPFVGAQEALRLARAQRPLLP